MLRRPTAIKLMHPDRTSDESIARFEREVQLTSQLTHPNTISIYDYGRTPEGVFYYAMEYISGIPLDELIAEDGPQSEGRVIHILRQVCGSLAEAHEIGTPVFDGRSVVEICTHHVQTSPERPSERIGQHIGEDLEAVILSCLEKDRDSRPACAREIASSLDSCGDAHSWTDAEAARWWKNRGGAEQRHEFKFGGAAAGATLIVGQGEPNETR